MEEMKLPEYVEYENLIDLTECQLVMFLEDNPDTEITIRYLEDEKTFKLQLKDSNTYEVIAYKVKSPLTEDCMGHVLEGLEQTFIRHGCVRI